jgi:hydroxyethylthiazole kinase-like uncharacterized protein yjeF
MTHSDPSYQNVELITEAEVRAALPKRARDVSKSNFGHVLVIGGDYGMPGAVRMAAEAAARVGAGLISVATHPEHVAVVAAQRPELMCHAVHNKTELLPLLKKATVIVIGPGLGQSDWSRELLLVAFAATQLKVVDADALNLLAKHPIKQNNWVLTPHPGEAARLLQTETTQIQADRIAAVKELQKRYGGVAVLKGVGTLVQAAEGLPAICQLGNPGMASGGMGDILSGVIGGLLAQGLSPIQAARVGVYIHAKAADLAAATSGERGLLATDLLPYLQQLVNP